MAFRHTFQITAAVIIAVLAGVVAGSAGAVDAKNAQIAYSSTWDGQADIYAMTADGKLQVNLTHDKTIGERVDVEPVWSPDGTLVAFERQYAKGGEALMLVNSDGSKLHSLFPPTAGDVDFCHPTFTPDGTSIVFSSNMDGNFELYRVNVTGKGPLVRITNTEAPIQNLEPQVSRDGRLIVFTRPELSMMGGSSIYTTKIAGGIVHQLTENYRFRGDHNPTFSPDGSMVAFSSDRAGSNDIYVMKASGLSVRPLTDKLSNDEHPTWSPTGTSLAFVSDTTGETQIYTVSLVTGGLQQLTFDNGFKTNPMWQSATLSPVSPPVPAPVSPPHPTPVSPPAISPISPPTPTLLPPPAPRPVPNFGGK